MKKSFACLAAAVATVVCLSASAALRWEPLYEPGCGGAIVSVAVSPHNPQHVVSGGDMLGTAASFDGGESWRPGMGLPSYEMATPTFHPTRADELWIGSCMGPFVSRDGGLTWQGRRNGLPAPCPWKYTAMVEKVLVDPARPARLLAFGGSSRRWGTCATMGAVWLSENGGDAWRRLGTITADGFTTNDVKGANLVKAWWGAEKTPWAHVFAAGVGWFSSVDGGLTWRRRKVAGLPGALAGVTTHPTDPNVVWGVVAPGEPGADGKRTPGAIWRSDDRGRTFRPSDAGIDKIADAHPRIVTNFGEIEVSQSNPNRLYVSDLGWRAASIWVSDDGGASWRRGCARWTLETACYAGPSCRIAASPTEPDVAYAYNSEYVLKTTDGGRTWADMTAVRPDPAKPDHWRGRGWNGWCSQRITFNPYRKGQSVVQAMDAARGWISDDGLKSWHYAHGGVAPWCGGVGAAFAKDGTIYLTSGQRGANCGVLVSRDGGATWRAWHGAACGLPAFGDGAYGDVWVDPDDGTRAFVVFGDALYRTADGGETWARDATVAQAGAFVVDPTKPTRFYVRNRQGVFVTEDDWKTFRPLDFDGESEGRIFCDARGRLLACRGRVGDPARRGLWRHDPATGGWTRLHDDALACAVAADPTDPTRLVLTTMDNPYHDFAGGHGVWVSADDGRTWTAANDGLYVRRLTCVAFDPFDPERLVAGTSGGGFVTTRWPKR